MEIEDGVWWGWKRPRFSVTGSDVFPRHEAAEGARPCGKVLTRSLPHGQIHTSVHAQAASSHFPLFVLYVHLFISYLWFPSCRNDKLRVVHSLNWYLELTIMTLKLAKPSLNGFVMFVHHVGYPIWTFVSSWPHPKKLYWLHIRAEFPSGAQSSSIITKAACLIGHLDLIHLCVNFERSHGQVYTLYLCDCVSNKCIQVKVKL